MKIQRNSFSFLLVATDIDKNITKVAICKLYLDISRLRVLTLYILSSLEKATTLSLSILYNLYPIRYIVMGFLNFVMTSHLQWVQCPSTYRWLIWIELHPIWLLTQIGIKLIEIIERLSPYFERFMEKSYCIFLLGYQYPCFTFRSLLLCQSP